MIQNPVMFMFIIKIEYHSSFILKNTKYIFINNQLCFKEMQDGSWVCIKYLGNFMI